MPYRGSCGIVGEPGGNHWLYSEAYQRIAHPVLRVAQTRERGSLSATATAGFRQQAQETQDLHIFMHVLGLRRLQAAGMVLESRVGDDMTECLLADSALPVVLVPVHTRAELGLGVIQVEGKNLLQSNH